MIANKKTAFKMNIPIKNGIKLITKNTPSEKNVLTIFNSLILLSKSD